MKCSNCKQQVPDGLRICVVCGADLGFPNVRAALAADERGALDARYHAAVTDAADRQCRQVLSEFEETVRHTKAVICRSWSIACMLLSSDNELYATYHQMVRAELRLPSPNEFDVVRVAVDATLFPHYFEDIRFGALSLNGRGPSSYGACSIVLRDAAIALRASVFEENSIVFCRKHKLAIGSRPPMGYRATWDDRPRLAVAKLHRHVGRHTKPEHFPELLMRQRGRTDTDDFIEVHIYGPIHRRSVERVTGPAPPSAEDKVLVKSLRRKLGEIGASVELY